jgi:hypothetical protein
MVMDKIKIDIPSEDAPRDILAPQYLLSQNRVVDPDSMGFVNLI